MGFCSSRRWLLTVGITWLGTVGLGPLPAGQARAEDENEALSPFAEGTFYEADSKRENLLYHWKLFASEDGERRRTEYFTPDGELAAKEEVWLDGGEFERYTVAELTAGRTALVRRVADKIEFSYTKDGATETRTEDYKRGFVVGPTLVPYIQSHWDRLMQGKDLEATFGVFRRRRAIGLKIWKDEEKSQDGADSVVLKIRPRNFVLAAFVKPIYLTFSPDGRTLYGFLGRSVPLRKVDGKWKPARVDGIFRGAGRTGPGLMLPVPAVGR